MDINDIIFNYQNSLPDDIRKNLGIHYTRIEDAIKITKEVFDTTIHPINKVLEPSCGGGAFAVAIYYDLLSRGYKGIDIINNILICIDIDESAAKITHDILKTLEPNSSPNIIIGDTLKLASEESFNKFDAVIGNPPYVRTHNINESDKTIYRKHYKSFKGFADLSIAFIEMAFNSLNNNGVLGYIVTDQFARSEAGKTIRSLIKNHLHIYDERNSDSKFKAGVCVVDLVVKKNQTNDKIQYNGVSIDRSLIGNNEWVFQPAYIIKGRTLKDLGIELKLGVVTGCDKAFIGDFDPKPWNVPVVRGKDKGDSNKRLILVDPNKTPCNEVIQILSQCSELVEKREKANKNLWSLNGFPSGINWGKDNFIVRRIGGSLSEIYRIPPGTYCTDTYYVLSIPENINIEKLLDLFKSRIILDQCDSLMSKRGNLYEIHASKFSRIIIPDNMVPEIVDDPYFVF